MDEVMVGRALPIIYNYTDGFIGSRGPTAYLGR